METIWVECAIGPIVCTRGTGVNIGSNGFSRQAPGFIDHVVNKKADIIRVYLPQDANTLL